MINTVNVLDHLKCMKMEEWLNIIKTFVAVAVAAKGFREINKWKKETKWKRQYELAEEVLSLFKEARDKLMFIRNPFIYPNEGQSREKDERESSVQTKAYDRANIYYERYLKVSDVFNQLDTLRYRFTTVFGKGEKPFMDLKRLISEVLEAVQMLREHYWIYYSEEERKTYETDTKKYEKVIRASMKDDIVQDKMNEIIKEVEQIVKPIMARGK